MRRSWLVILLCLAASPAYGVSLTGYYKLDDATPATAAATIGTNGTYQGSFVAADVGLAGSPGDPTGKSVRYQTTGTLDRRIEIPTRGGMPSGTNFTMSMWVRADVDSRDMALVNNSNSFAASNNLNIFRDDVNASNAAHTNFIAAIVGGDPPTRANSAQNSFNDTNWHLLSITYDTTAVGDTTRIFIDGVRSSFNAANNTVAITNTTIGLGNVLGTSTNQMGGQLDEVGFWSRTLNASEQRALFFLNTNSQNNIDAAGAATLLDFFEVGTPGNTITVDGTNFLYVPNVTTFGGTPGLSLLVGSQMVLGLNPSGTSGLVSFVVPEPADLAVWTLLGAMSLVVACRRKWKR